MTDAYQPTSDLVHEQVALYEATDGRRGARWRAADGPQIVATGCRATPPPAFIVRDVDDGVESRYARMAAC